MITEAQLQKRLAEGEYVETTAEMTPGYRQVLTRMLLVAGDTEFMSVPFLCSYFDVDIPSRYVRQIIAIIQDELGHAQIDYRLAEDLGLPVEKLIYERDISDFRYPFMFDMPVESWEEATVIEALGEFAGGCIVGDILENTSYAPWRRALKKTLVEENFHSRFGKAVLEDAVSTKEGKRAVQNALDWQFPLYIEWFGPADSANPDPSGLITGYRLRGDGSDRLRQEWMDYAVPLVTGLGLEVPAHYDDDAQQWVLEFPFPCYFDPSEKKWDFDRPQTWEQFNERWKARGPLAKRNIAAVRDGYQGLRKLADA